MVRFRQVEFQARLGLCARRLRHGQLGVGLLLAIIVLLTSGPSVSAQEARVGDRPVGSDARNGPLSHIPRVGTSPFDPPDHKDTVFVVDSAPGLDTPCRFKSGGSLVFDIEVDRFIGDRDKLKNNGLLGENAYLRMPGYDVDSSGGGGSVQPEIDKVYFNGEIVNGDHLRGEDGKWILNNFSIPIEEVKFPSDPKSGGTLTPAINTVRIDIDTANSEDTWCTAVDWAALDIEVARPLLTVHGIFSKSGTWHQGSHNWHQTMQSLGIPYSSIDLHTGFTIGLDSIQDNAGDLAAKIDELKARWGVDRVNIVSHSKGGLDSRHYLESRPTVEKLVQLGTPNAGTPAANAAQAAAIRLLGIVPTAIIDGLAGPGGLQLTTYFMETYNLFHGSNPQTTYFSLGGDYRFGGTGIVDAVVQDFYDGPNDVLVPVNSVHALGYASHFVHTSIGSGDTSAMHTGLTSSQNVYGKVKSLIEAIGRPTPSGYAALAEPAAGETMSSSHGQSATAAGAVSQGETKSHTITVDAMSAVTFVLHHGAGELSLVLRTPGGQLIDPGIATSSPSMGYQVVGGGMRFEMYSIASPQPGEWTLEVTGDSVDNPSGQQPYVLMSMFAGSTVELQAGVDSSAYRVGDTIVVTATASEGGTPLTGASASAEFVLPDETTTIVSLHDDGQAGDAAANDGTYTGRFDDTANGGLYRILVTVEKPSSPQFSRDALLLAPVATSDSGLNGGFSDYGNDTNGDGLFDELVIDVGVDATASATYRVFAALSDHNGDLISTTSAEAALSPGAGTLTLRFDGTHIYASAADGPYTLSLVRLAEDDGFSVFPLEEQSNAHTTAAYLFSQFQGSAILVPGTGSDMGTDMDGNGLYDQLTINLGLEIQNEDNYDWSARLVDPLGTELGVLASTGYLNKGHNEITFTFDGNTIGANGVHGPYSLNDLLIFSGTDSAVVFEAYSTVAYKASEFEGYTGNLPPVAEAGGSYQGGEGETIALDASASSDPDGSIILYEWDLDNDGVHDDATGATTDAVFPEDGSYSVGLKVTDDGGESDTDTAQVTVVNATPATGAIDAPAGPLPVHASIHFSVPFSDAGVLDAHTATWSWGDGSESPGFVSEIQGSGSVRGSHAYATPGEYIVTVTVEDDDGDAGSTALEPVIIRETVRLPQLEQGQ